MKITALFTSLMVIVSLALLPSLVVAEETKDGTSVITPAPASVQTSPPAPSLPPSPPPAEATTPPAPDKKPITADEVQTNLNFVWTLIAAFLVFIMQEGFALVEDRKSVV